MEVLIADEHIAEELVLEGHPVECLRQLLTRGNLGTQVVGALALLLVGDVGALLLKLVSPLLLRQAVGPLHQQVAPAGVEEVGHPSAADGHVHHVALVPQRVGDGQLGAVAAAGGQRQRGVGGCRGGEVEVAGVHVLLLHGKGEVERRVVVVKEHHGLLLLVLKVLERSLADHAAVAVHLHLHQLVLQGEHLLSPVHGGTEERVGVQRSRVGLGLGNAVSHYLRLDVRQALLLHGNAVRLAHGSYLLLRGLVDNTEADNHGCYQNNSYKCVSVHEMIV